MYLPFEQMPEHSRVWVYQGSSLMNDETIAMLRNSAIQFVENWTAHQAGLKASVEVFHGLFVVFAVDETFNDASGCSLDKKVHFMKEAGVATGQNFFDRMQLAIVTSDLPLLVRLQELDQSIAQGAVDARALFYDNLVTTMDQFRTAWKKPIENSWPSNFITAASKSS